MMDSKLVHKLERVVEKHIPAVSNKKSKLLSYAYTIRLHSEKHEAIFQRFSNRNDLYRLDDLAKALKDSKNMLAAIPENISVEIKRRVPDVENELLISEYLHHPEGEQEGIKTITKQYSLHDDESPQLIKEARQSEKHILTGRTREGDDQLFHLLARGVNSLHLAVKSLQNSSLVRRKTVGNLHSQEAAVALACKLIWEKEGGIAPKDIEKAKFGPFGRFVRDVFKEFRFPETKVRMSYLTVVRELKFGTHADFFVSIEKPKNLD